MTVPVASNQSASPIQLGSQFLVLLTFQRVEDPGLEPRCLGITPGFARFTRFTGQLIRLHEMEIDGGEDFTREVRPVGLYQVGQGGVAPTRRQVGHRARIQ